MFMSTLLKRVYDKPGPQDGVRILVDRLWPRGLSKHGARIDLWLKEVAPSHELRKWFHGNRSRWKDFRRRYVEELRHNEEALEPIIDQATKGTVTLVYASRRSDTSHLGTSGEFRTSSLAAEISIRVFTILSV